MATSDALDFPSLLPPEVASHIASWIIAATGDTANPSIGQFAANTLLASSVSRQWREIFCTEAIWREIGRRAELFLLRPRYHKAFPLRGPPFLFRLSEIHPLMPVESHPNLLAKVSLPQLEHIVRTRWKLLGVHRPSAMSASLNRAHRTFWEGHVRSANVSWIAPVDDTVTFSCLHKLSFAAHLRDLRREFISKFEISALEWDFRFNTRALNLQSTSPQNVERELEAIAAGERPSRRIASFLDPGMDQSWPAYFDPDFVYRSADFFHDTEQEMRMVWRFVGDSEGELNESDDAKKKHVRSRMRMVQVAQYMPHSVSRDARGRWVIRNSAGGSRNHTFLTLNGVEDVFL
ncbi:hypothetical protein M427DRAFT_51965 [Gonapodya prolifera JEL478]|uniref:F-box domain-containing protein n=1 Tax=Gonapodya prolifera (strain JEL478) TaxID=1344416 RepID=A0A139AWA8_GONPJ|nr:hypothetical protein M427DRAFT_51965 [Gonapodya prolifera JEL478]|eukprot:KXS21031.1 hypothetical protein M427DRAFT_51965 [Gonapodya prolifera JEL478]